MAELEITLRSLTDIDQRTEVFDSTVKDCKIRQVFREAEISPNYSKTLNFWIPFSYSISL